MRERPENVRATSRAARLFAWNEELWNVTFAGSSGRITSLERRFHHALFGDGALTVRFESWPDEGRLNPGRVVVTSNGREVTRLDFQPLARGAKVDVPAGRDNRDRARFIGMDEIVLREVVPHLYAIELASINTRVMVAEFADHAVVLEGAYNSRNCDKIARRVREKIGKPVRYFAFSHLHAQYVGGVRSWIHEGATILVPPTTAPMIEEIAAAKNELRPDALSRDRKALRLETIAERRRLEDVTNALEIYNVESGHTDEYFLFYFPRQKILMTGDLLFYRPGKPLSGRSKKLCETMAKLGLDIETFYATWPLDGYGTKNVVSADEMRKACAQSQEPAGAAAPGK
jgi:glyoxylase-like metal-dependent hydrolase (beta-lactamase superfamily II)